MSCGSLKVFKFNRLISYPEALILQQNLVNQKLLNRTSEPDYLILLEHEPCVTLGRRCHSESIKSSYPIFKVIVVDNALFYLFSHHVVER